MSKRAFTALVLVAALAAPVPAMADRGRDRGLLGTLLGQTGDLVAHNDNGLLESLIAPPGSRKGRNGPGLLEQLVFGPRDRQIIANYFLRNPGHLDYLPSGLRRQLVTKGRVPREVARQPLPERLAERLAPLPDGYERTIVGPDVLLIEARSGLIIDIVRDVVR